MKPTDITDHEFKPIDSANLKGFQITTINCILDDEIGVGFFGVGWKYTMEAT